MKLESKAYSFVKAVEQHLHSLLVDMTGKKILIAVSGGVDSCVLLDVLWQWREPLRLHLAVCHINHRLRGSESNDDEAFVIQRTRDYNLSLTVRRFDEPDLARVRSGNLEEQARNLRYQLLAHTAEELNYDYVATGHTKSDQAETVLHRVLRSSGVSGLSGILPLCVIQGQSVIRPLLCHTRDDVMDYAQRMNLSYRHDRMNDDEQYTRVRIRHSLLPLLKEQYNPNVEESLSRLAAVCKDEDDFWERHLQFMRQQVGEGIADSPADRNHFLQFTPAEQKRFIRWMFQQSGIDPNFTQIMNSLNIVTCQKPQGEIHLQDDIHFIRRYNQFYVGQSILPDILLKPVDINVPGKTIVPDLHLEILTEWQTKNVINLKSAALWQTAIDFDAVRNGLQIRTRQEGDSIQPQGMKGKKKLKKILQEQAVPLEKRCALPILCDQDEIVWVPGCCESEKYKITPLTNIALHIMINPI